MGVTNFPDGLNIGSNAGATAVFQLGGTEVAITAAEVNAIHNAGGIDQTEFDLLDGAIAGTAVASKVLALGADKNVDTIDVAASGLKIATVAVTATAAELNYIDGSVVGTAIASKALVLGSSKNVDTIDVAASGLKLATVAVTATAAELNTLAGALGAKALTYDSATPQVVASGSTAITGSGTVATGLAGAAVAVVVAGLRNMGTAAGDPLVVSANPTGSGGSVIFTVRDEDGVQSTVAGTVDWIAISTAA